MWNSSELIRIELGTDIVKAANSPDTRSWFERWIDMSAPEDDAQMLFNGINFVQSEFRKKNIVLPNIQLAKNNNIAGNEFICYWGIEKCHYSIKTDYGFPYELVEELLEFIKRKASTYGSAVADVEVRDSFLSNSIEMTRQGKIQDAYENYIRAYYLSKYNGDFYTSAQILSEVGGIVARDGQLDLAAQFIDTASDYCNMPNLVDANLKCQIYLNAASIYKSISYDKSFEYLGKCYQAASMSNNLNFKFLSLLGYAENNSVLGYYEDAINQYKEALGMLNPNYNDVMCIIQKQIMELYDMLVKKMEQNKETQIKLFNRSIEIIKIVLKPLLEAAIYKLFNVGGVASIFSFGKTIQVKGSVTNSKIFIGNKNSLN